VYVSGRGAPHISSAGDAEPSTERPDLSKQPLDETLDFALGNLAGMVDPPQVEKYRGYLGYLKKKEPQKLIDFTETMICDMMVSSPPLISADKKAPVECPMQYWYSDADEVWPLKREGFKVAACNYDCLHETWRGYAKKDGFTATLVPGYGHGDLGGPDSPLFTYILEDLSKLAVDIVK